MYICMRCVIGMCLPCKAKNYYNLTVLECIHIYNYTEMTGSIQLSYTVSQSGMRAATNISNEASSPRVTCSGRAPANVHAVCVVVMRMSYA